MPGTWRKLHYVQRPAKNIERKMIAELFFRVDRVRPLEEWRYVGLGSVYFADFELFHRKLGLTSMSNIEIEDTMESRTRFEFNKPFGCIDLEWGSAGTILPTLPWDGPTAVWLDYDSKLNADVLGDVGHVVTLCRAPSVLFVSVNVESSGAPNEQVLAEFEENVTPDRVPASTAPGDVAGWGLAGVAYQVLVAEIQGALADRNGVEDAANQVAWHQFVHFQYADGARMLTVGGLLHDAEDIKAVNLAGFDQLFFARTSEAAYRIRVPNLTTREILHLAGQMPATHDAVDHQGIPERERRDFVQAYRYFPSFIEADL
jgi:hypothetical protein